MGLVGMGMEEDGMGWDGDGMGWKRMGWGWDGMGQDDGMGWDGMGWDGMGWDGMEEHRAGQDTAVPLRRPPATRRPFALQQQWTAAERGVHPAALPQGAARVLRAHPQARGLQED